MKQKNNAVAEQISIRTQTVVNTGVYLDPETRDDLKDKKHLEAVKKAREQYKRGEVRDIREFFKSFK